MHILFLSDNFPPEVNAPASRTFEHCREWVKAGHRVTVITCAPNFPKGIVHSGYRNQLRPQRELMDGIHVIRVWSYITSNEGFLLRIIDYLSYMLTAIIAAPSVRKVDLVVGTSPQFFTACAAYVVSRCKGIPFVFELRDLWPESIRAVGAMRKSRILDVLEQVELFLYRRAIKVVSVTQSFKRNLIERGIDPEKISVVTNGVDLSLFGPKKKDSDLVRELDLGGKFVTGYIGTHGMAHALETILETAHLLQERGEGELFHFILLGDGARKSPLQEMASQLGLKHITFIDTVPKEEVSRYWSILDVSIIHLKDIDTFKTVIPSKLFESMGMGIPVLHGIRGESAEIVENGESGLLFEPEVPQSLCEGLFRLRGDKSTYENLRRNCLREAAKYDRLNLARQMLKVLGEVDNDKN